MIIVNLDIMMAKRKISSTELAEKLGITPANLSILKTNKGKAIRFSTLDKICEVLDCLPGDILDYKKGMRYMSNIFISSLIFSIWFVILFIGKSIGLSMLIFVVPFTCYLLSVLEKNNKEVNGKARVLMVPITLLSGTYLIFNNWFFNMMNIVVIPILIVMMVVQFIDKKLSIKMLGVKVLETIFMPIDYLGETLYKLEEIIEEKFKVQPNKNKNRSGAKILKGIGITIPIALVILVLLISADETFASFFIDLFDGFIETLIQMKLYDISIKIVIGMLVFLYLSAFLYTLISRYDREEELPKEQKDKDTTTIKIVLGTLNIIYLFFCIIQIKSLFSGDLEINYSQSARQGFFQLVIVSIINLVTILIAKATDNKEESRFKFVNIMCMLMIIFTFIILISSSMRMYYYENAFGYTLLRLLVYCVLITEAILLIPTILYVFDCKIKLAKSYFIVIISMYICMNFANFDNMIAKRNVDRYMDTGKIDVNYLINNTRTDATEQIVRILETDRHEDYVKIQVYEYLEMMEEDFDKDMDFRDFNISKKNAKSIIEDVIE